MSLPIVHVPRSGRAIDRWITMIQIGTLVVILLVAAMTWGALTGSWSAADNSDRVAQGNNLATCRAQARVPIDRARVDLDKARTDLEIATGAGLAAAADLDASTQPDIAKVPALLASIQQATEGVDKATSSYEDAINRSISDPAGFIKSCQTP